MSYLNEFHKKIQKKDFLSFLQLWEEYCTCDEVDGIELKKILELVLDSDYSAQFGQYAESILPLWKSIEDERLANEVFEKIIDVQTTQSPLLSELTHQFLKEHFSEDKFFHEKMRLVGMRTCENFTRAISNYKLLSHMDKGCFVYHTAGWGTGEVMELSLIREELTLEFENVLGLKNLSFENAFKTLLPLKKDHFLAKRFGDPDALEAMAKSWPIEMIKKMLTDLGPKSASEIKEELLEVVIPQKDWSSWWQSTRAKIKKTTSIEVPPTVHGSFKLLSQEQSHIERLIDNLKKEKSLSSKIVLMYSFVRDFPELLRDQETLEILRREVDLLLESTPSSSQRFQLYLIASETHGKERYSEEITNYIAGLEDIDHVIEEIEVISYKKKVLIYLRKQRPEWEVLFADLFFKLQHTILREYLLKELVADAQDELKKVLDKILHSPSHHAELLFWYFQKACSDASLPLSDSHGKTKLLEAYLIAISQLERHKHHQTLTKRMAHLLTQKKFTLFRELLDAIEPAFLKELLLLVSKCHTFSSHDIKIIYSLIYVVAPHLKDASTQEEETSENYLWVSESALKDKREYLHHLSTVEMVDVAKEIEEARSHGDLRENSEYKFALERRSRIQSEIAALSAQVESARILTSADIDSSKVGIGTSVNLRSSDGVKNITIMGPWDADPKVGIIALESRLAQQMAGKTVGDSLEIEGQSYRIQEISSAL